MATWTYFTSYLDGSRPITANERDELYSQLSALLTGVCAGNGYSLNATDQAAITASKLATDRASLDGPGATNTRDHLEEVIATMSAIFTNYDTAVDDALSGEGITDTERDDMISALVDDHRLWNYYKRLIDALTCACTAPTLLCRTASASKTKYGWNECPSFTSGVSRYFRTLTLSGSITGVVCCLENPGYEVDPCTRTVGCTLNAVEGGGPYGSLVGMAITIPDYSSGCSNSTNIENVCDPPPCCREPCAGDVTETSAEVATHSYLCDDEVDYGSWTVTGSDEYTTSALFSAVDSALGSASWSSWSSVSCSGAFVDLSTDQVTYTKRKLEYKFELPEDLVEGQCYRITWKERFTPEGGSAVDTDKSYEWDGEATETGVYSITPDNTLQGTWTIVSVTAVCTGCEE